MNELQAIEILLDANRGIYIPQAFAQEIVGQSQPSDSESYWRHVSQEDWDILMTGPDHDLYWEAWKNVPDTATFSADGHTSTLHQDRGLFAICSALLSPLQRAEFFGPE